MHLPSQCDSTYSCLLTHFSLLPEHIGNTHWLGLLLFSIQVCTMSKFPKEIDPLWDNCKDGTLLCYLLLQDKLALCNRSYHVSQGRHLIHIRLVRKELRTNMRTIQLWPCMHHKVVRHYFQSCSDFESKRSNFMCMGRKSGSFSKQRVRNSVRIYFTGWPWVHAPTSEVSLSLKRR